MGLYPAMHNPDVPHTFMRRVPAAWKQRHPLLLNRTEERQKECLFQVQISVDMLLSNLAYLVPGSARTRPPAICSTS